MGAHRAPIKKVHSFAGVDRISIRHGDCRVRIELAAGEVLQCGIELGVRLGLVARSSAGGGLLASSLKDRPRSGGMVHVCVAVSGRAIDPE